MSETALDHDPELVTLMREFCAKCDKKDVGAFLILVSKTHAMQSHSFPSWTALQPGVDSNHVVVRARRDEFPSGEAQDEAIKFSLHYLGRVADFSQMVAGKFGDLCARITKASGITVQNDKSYVPFRK